ncbi:MAG: NUDIX hydrolase [Candidatus Sungiibacteriota bacterium]|uniref:NUDIX hydrolase n=1 Tax=Candidatus Sungiibacteriota bacterium TaxID=2750080 RepID=A0A7T5RJU5_9BACT|nr:MAG: NUDIX hydrolase [Candidatus Sungbacteria bacterium]
MDLELLTPQKVGEATELVKRVFGKTLLSQKFRKPTTGEIYEYAMHDYKSGKVPSLVFPLNVKHEVVALRQFRHAANHWLWEFPGGNQVTDELPEEVAKRELLEETGYAPTQLILLTPKPIWCEPADYVNPFYAFLATDCNLTSKPLLDPTEYLEVKTFPLSQWLAMIWDGKIRDSKTIAITMLALPHLNTEVRNYK